MLDKMKLKRILPQWLGIKAMALYPYILATKKAKLTEVDVNHEEIHLAQQRELLIIFFYLWYVGEWAVKSIINRKDAYYDISFEKEAYANERDLTYLVRRKTSNLVIVFRTLCVMATCLIIYLMA